MDEEKIAENKTRKSKAPDQNSDTVMVRLVAAHTHQGETHQAGETIAVRSSQLRQLREWGVIK